jgi:hypothetical protein
MKLSHSLLLLLHLVLDVHMVLWYDFSTMWDKVLGIGILPGMWFQGQELE